MCSGRIDLEFILQAFAQGIDGVLIGGCRLGECNYVTHGNYHAQNLAVLARQILQAIDVDPQRLGIEFMSAGEGIHFAEVVDAFVARIKALGPLGSGDESSGEILAGRLAAVRAKVPFIKVETREKMLTRHDNLAAAEALFDAEAVDRLLNQQVAYHIDPQRCQACRICGRRCPVGAIDGAKGRIHVIDQDLCIRCGACLTACPKKFGAVERLVDEPLPKPISEEKREIVRKVKA